MKRCEGLDGRVCHGEAKRKDRFCPSCEAEMMRRMEASGYLVQIEGEDTAEPIPVRLSRPVARFG
jgi:hypothetical protein